MARQRLHWQGRCARRLVAACAFSTVVVLGATAGTSSAQSVDECVRKKVAEGVERAKAMTECLRSETPSGTLPGSDDSSTSTVTLLLIGLGGAALGAAAVWLLRTPRAPAAAVAAPITAPMATPAPFAAPGNPAPPPVDRSRPLIVALIDLGDRVNSGALRAEIVAALAQAGVQSIEPAPGTAFDATRMRGVGNAPAPDAGWVGTVASTERAGFADGPTVIRLPEVVVYTADA